MANVRSAKAKGRTGQQEIRDKLYALFPQLEEGDIKSAIMGEGGADIQLSPAAHKLMPISIEVKRRKTGMKTQYDWVQQARSHTMDPPVVFFRADRSEWLVITPVDHYLELLKVWKDAKKDQEPSK